MAEQIDLKTFKTDVADYEAARPEYPIGITDWITDEFLIDETSIILELGAGTGKFTPRIIASHPKEIIAVDVYPEMLDVLRKKFPNVDCRAGSAMAIPLEDESVDLVLCAQCFHWFANEEAMKEIYRVLKPNGKLGLVWNTRDDTVPWIEKVSKILGRYRKDAPSFVSWKWAELFPGHGFGKLRYCAFPFSRCLTVEELHTLMNSFSFIYKLPEEEKEKVHAELDEIAKTIPRVQNTDQIKLCYQTMAFSSEKEPAK
ncbi:trans-aconitate 3-methyltransferase [Schizosaccharomyces pombe]|uniref:Uncharacterized methyltransferase-like C25B8.10 n=1 Tax=Schizosaccharomyces pombe (strain 972 / ATCC 24843) TaxID=284812 RepID=YL8A_SCHPO|nr:putative trans-aconitate 3-methyltransferase [Schizosaccharomyces pombe]Q9UTA8.1 RecName: Full=Uncharacterized methyltransferase-like C25B8.10 [Schizosaccharomyces pombe 972h-]CAB61776.1 trans-aconitate 3-methyltransferase (predicted) [Schizosaccharomyces pombe]|eukprot:NP_594470.1 putative trans-aconitate 3-methyltransferase [Schizosaccharomyces pombe]